MNWAGYAAQMRVYDDRVNRMTLAQTQKLCETRALRQPDLSISRIVSTIKQTARNSETRTSGAWTAIERALPANLLPHLWIESASPTQVTLGVDSSAAAYQVDRALREGALLAIRAAMLTPGLRVRTRVGTEPQGL